MKPYTVLVRASVVQDLSALESDDAGNFWRFVIALEANPFVDGDFEEMIEGVPVKAKVLRNYSVLFAVDHPAREVRILWLLRSD
jgi:hypothetical protein